MRIAHVGVEVIPAANGAFVGGLAKNVATIGQAQKKRGDDVELFTTDLRESLEDGREAAHGTIRRIAATGSYGSFLFASTFMARVARALRKAHNERPFDLVHVHSGYAAFASLGYLLGGIDARKVFSLYSPNLRTVPGHDCNGSSKLGGERLSHHSLSRFDSVLVPSQNLRSRLLGVGLAPDKVAQVPPALDDCFYETLPGRDSARTSLGLPSDRPIVLFVGNYSPWKGVEVLLRAMARARAAGTDAILLTAWGEPYRWSGNRRKVVLAQLERLALRQAIIQLGVVPDIRILLRAADVLVAPFLCTCKVLDFPLSILEAMACATPVIGTAVGGVPEILDGRERGVIVPPGRDGELSEALQIMLADPSRARAIGVAGWRWVQARFETSTILPVVDSVYNAAPSQRGQEQPVPHESLPEARP